MKKSKIEELRDRGFDLSEAIPFQKAWKVRCSQCEALVINGHATHETGCPNQPRPDEDEEEDTHARNG